MTTAVLFNSFNDGELSPLISGRTDMPQYAKGGDTCLNFIPTPQGPLLRRGGSRYVGQTGLGTNPSLLIRFSRSQTESYVLEFYTDGGGLGQLRFWFNGGLVQTGGLTTYIIATGYIQSDLFNTDGTAKLQVSESVDVLYIATPRVPVNVLSFFGPNNWTYAPIVNADGPWNDGNANKAATVYATGSVAVGSVVTLNSFQSVWQPGHVGALFRLHVKDLSLVKPWQPGQRSPNMAVGVQRRAGFQTYQATTVSAGTAPTGGTTLTFVQTGGVTPTSTLGTVWDGDQSTTLDPVGGATYYSTGVQWTYQDCGYGVVLITGYTSAIQVTGTVMRQLPAAVIGSGGASYLWEMGAWNSIDGYPSCVTFFRQRLTFAGRNRIWMSVAGDFANFADLSFGQVLQDSAVTVQALSDQDNTIVALSPSDTLLVCTTGAEFLVGQQATNDPFGPQNVMVALQSTYGCRAVVPVRVQQYALFVQKNGRSVRELSYQFSAEPAGSYLSNDLTVLSEHITAGGIVTQAWARNPYTQIYMALGNGNLISFTYNPEQNVKAWARHDLGGNGKVVSIAVVPNGSGDWDDVYLTVKRSFTTGSVTTVFYQIERIEQPFQNLPGQSQQNAFYVDCGLTLNSPINSILTPSNNITTKGALAIFNTNGTFLTTDVNRYIHYDWQTTAIGEDGLSYPKATKGIALITALLTSTSVAATIIAPFPQLFGGTIAANSWRMTSTSLLAASIPLGWANQTISFLADGACMPDQVYVSGNITLPFPASIVQAGIKSPAVFRTMKPDTQGQTGSLLGKIRKLVRATLRFVNSLGFEIGADISHMIPVEMRSSAIPSDNPPPIQTGDSDRLDFTGDFDRDGRLMIRQEQPLPLTICAIAIALDTQEDS